MSNWFGLCEQNTYVVIVGGAYVYQSTSLVSDKRTKIFKESINASWSSGGTAVQYQHFPHFSRSNHSHSCENLVYD